MQTLFMVFTYRVSWNFFFFFTKHDRILQDPSHLNSIRPYRGFTHFYPGLRSPFLFRVSDYKAASLKKKNLSTPVFFDQFPLRFSFQFGVWCWHRVLVGLLFFFVCLFFWFEWLLQRPSPSVTELRKSAREESRGKKKRNKKSFNSPGVTSSGDVIADVTGGGWIGFHSSPRRTDNEPTCSLFIMALWRWENEKKKKERCGDPSRRNAAFYLSRFRVLLCVCVCVCVCSFVFLCSTTSN